MSTPVRSSTVESTGGTSQIRMEQDSQDEPVVSSALGNGTEQTHDTSSGRSSYDAVLLEAQTYYGDGKPAFCVHRRDYTTKTVKLSAGEEKCDIAWKDWSGDLGYWVLTDEDGDRCIVKHQGAKYYRWEGVAKGFSHDPVASSLRASEKTMTTAQPSSKRAAKETDPIEAKSLRPRKAIQSMPYTAYNTQARYASQGVVLSQTQLEEVVATGTRVSAAAPTQSSMPDKKRKPKYSSNDDSIGSIQPDQHRPEVSLPAISSTTTRSPRNNLLQNILLRTRFNGFKDATIPITSTNFTDHASLFQCIKKKWQLKLKGRKILYCIAMFPWLGTDKNILLQESESDGLDAILDEVQEASEQERGRRIEVVVTVYEDEADENLTG